ncbi:hypothetical protein D0T60_18685, partial [Bacteroides sp. 224]|nr:hypothetical protein [Bacteroides sp. 224]
TVSWAVLSLGHVYEITSLCVWFMDKNRPLPPGSVFDPYREADYLRRKEMGFPMPLYHSAIETPEWSGAEEKYGDKNGRRRGKLLFHPEHSTNAPKVNKKKSQKRKR